MKSVIIITTAVLMLATPSDGRGLRLYPGEPLRSNAVIHAAKGRNGFLIRQQLSFGPYHSTEVHRSSIRKWYGYSGAPGLFWAEHMTGRQSITFTLTDGSQTTHVETVTHVKSTDLVIGDNRNSLPSVLINVLSTGTAAQANNFSAIISSSNTIWELFLDNTAAQMARRQPAGYLRSGNSYYTIVPVSTVDRKGTIASLPFGAIGLEFQDEDGKTQAAVSLQDNGEVYLNPSNILNNQILAAASAALLLQSNIE